MQCQGPSKEASLVTVWALRCVVCRHQCGQWGDMTNDGDGARTWICTADQMEVNITLLSLSIPSTCRSTPMVTPFHLVAALVAAHAALGAELYAPTLQFNWTLRPFDAPLKLSGWSPSDTANIGGTWTLPSTSNTATASVQFIGTALWYNGVGSNWAQTDSNGNAKVAGYASVVGDPSWAATTAETDLLQPASATVLWEHSTPRFQTYTMNIQAVYGSWTLDSAVIATGLNTTSSSITSLDDVPRTVVNFVGSDSQVNSTFYNLTGRWDVTDAAGSLPQHTTCYDDAVARIALPPGTSFIVINGTRSTASGNLYIKLAPVTDEYDQTTYVVDASFPYTTDAILFVLPIDTAVAQTLILDCVLEAQGQQGLTSITFYGW